MHGPFIKLCLSGPLLQNFTYYSTYSRRRIASGPILTMICLEKSPLVSSVLELGMYYSQWLAFLACLKPEFKQ